MEHLGTLFARCDRIFVFDTETTGLHFGRDEIIQLSGVTLEWKSGEAVAGPVYNRLLRLKPEQTVPPEIQALTGITPQDLERQGIPREQAAQEISSLVAGNTLLTAYNAHFDLSFLYYLLAAYGDPACLKGKDKLDLLTVFRDRRSYPHRLRDAISAYSLDSTVQNSHRADEDTMATVSVMAAMAAERDDLAQYINLFGYVPKYGPPRRPIRSVTYLPQPYNAPQPLYAGRK